VTATRLMHMGDASANLPLPKRLKPNARAMLSGV
jgi:hypothetical protein